MKNNEKINKLYKSKISKKGISLIILIIVISVMLVLASAIIISISTTNPIEEGQDAKYEYDVDNMQTVLLNVVSKIMTEKSSTLTVEPTELNTEKSGVKSTTGELKYKLKYAKSGESKEGKIIFDKKDDVQNTYYTGVKLPIYKEETTWSVDIDGNVLLKVGEKTYGKTTNTVVEEQE